MTRRAAPGSYVALAKHSKKFPKVLYMNQICAFHTSPVQEPFTCTTTDHSRTVASHIQSVAVYKKMNGINHTTQRAENESSLEGMTKLVVEEAGRAPTDIPRIPITLSEHKLAIARHWAVLLICSCFLPVALYIILKYAAHAKGSIVIGVSAAIFGLVSLPSLFLRTWALTKANSTTRPLGTTRWAMDHFNWNFVFGFMYVTVLIVVSTVLKPAKTRIASLPLALLLLQVCTQLLATTVMVPLRVRYPFQFSSMPRGEMARPALYTIVEDVVAVDGAQGTRFREVWDQRYLASAPIRTLLREMDLLWGISGVAVAVAVVVLIFKLHNEDISWIVGWTVPWVWAAVCALITVARTKAALTKERSSMGQQGSHFTTEDRVEGL